MLLVKGRNTSSNVMKVLWTLAEIGLKYEREDIGGPYGGNDGVEYRALNPNGLVPTVIDHDLVLWESNTIVRWLAANHSLGTLCPADTGDRARCEMWMDWQLSVLNPLMVPVFHPLVRLPAEDRDPAAIAAAAAKWGESWALLDAHLAGNRYVGGDSFTMADIPLGPLAFRWFELPIDRPDLPDLKRWHDALCERPAYRANVVKIGLV
ncbi:MAG: glutathione S-transferase [Alphaproteobacteria bacterium]